ncbi:SCP2 sterol-binding domain-containing protein [Actibacterium sp. MT2.3-13A]|uniref:ubiquinone anaerobic biosynthesis accessory factor UbiT n=1 Tax=Actibacterium sp. MT2.3-13A TaxID=2828332 RepID=UPI001BA644B9|nr:SCP2 sterol-binding domain-containing protein [Actibacterium sp. MT2.3-13A]
MMLRPLPLAPLSAALSMLARRVVTRHPGLLRRLGAHDRARFLIDPTDLPLVLCLEPRGGQVRVTAHRQAPRADVRIAGPLAALLGLVHGAYDGDALFFSRDLVIEGDTAAALALRNAIDDAELDLAEELTALPPVLAGALRRAIALAERRTGVALTRVAEGPAW